MHATAPPGNAIFGSGQWPAGSLRRGRVQSLLCRAFSRVTAQHNRQKKTGPLMRPRFSYIGGSGLALATSDVLVTIVHIHTTSFI